MSRWIDNPDIAFYRGMVYSFTAQSGPSPEGLRVLQVATGRTGTITAGPHTTYGCTVRFDDTGSTHYIGTDRLTFLGDGRGGPAPESGWVIEKKRQEKQ